MSAEDVRSTFISKLIYFFAGVVIALTLSKYSAREAYDLGFSRAVSNASDVCVAWWFKDSTQRVTDAKRFICQNTRSN